MSLGLKAVRGAIWTIGSSVGGRIIGLVSTLILTRFISPHEYGAVSVAIAIVLTAEEFTQLGLTQYIVAHPKSSRQTAFHATVYHMGFGLLALGIVALLREPLSRFFEAPEAAAFILGTVVSSLFDRVAVVPERILSRDMRFGVISRARVSSEILYAGLSIGLAVLMFGGMSIIYGNIAQWFIFMIWLLAASNFKDYLTPSRLNWDTTRKLFAFGIPLSIGHSANFASRRWDNLLMARFFGTAMLGRYNLAYNLADIPATHVGEHIGDVLLPSFARMEPEQRRDALVRATALLSLIIAPMAVGLGAVAPTVTSAIFDPRWEQMAPMLAILSALSVFRPVGWTIISYLQAIDRPKTVMVLEVGKVGILLGAIVALAPFGELWACAAVGVAFGLHAAVGIWSVHKFDQVPLFKMSWGVVPPLMACVPMALSVYGIRYYLTSIGWEGGVLALICELLVGMVVFIPSGLLLAPTVSREFIRLVKKALGRGGDEDDDDDDDDDE